MALPGMLSIDAPLADVDWTIGPTVAAFGLMSASEVLRALRRANSVAAVVLILASLIWARGGTLAIHLALSTALFALSIPRGRIKHRFGSGWTGLIGEHTSAQDSG